MSTPEIKPDEPDILEGIQIYFSGVCNQNRVRTLSNLILKIAVSSVIIGSTMIVLTFLNSVSNKERIFVPVLTILIVLAEIAGSLWFVLVYEYSFFKNIETSGTNNTNGTICLAEREQTQKTKELIQRGFLWTGIGLLGFIGPLAIIRMF